MAYLAPAEFAKKVVDAGESKLHMATRDVLIRAFMAGAILALAAVFAITIAGANRVTIDWCAPVSSWFLYVVFIGL